MFQCPRGLSVFYCGSASVTRLVKGNPVALVANTILKIKKGFLGFFIITRWRSEFNISSVMPLGLISEFLWGSICLHALHIVGKVIHIPAFAIT